MRKKFFMKNFITFIIPIFIPVLIFSLMSISIFQNTLKKDINSNTQSALKLSKDNMDLLLSDVNFLSVSIDSNPSLLLTLFKNLSSDTAPYEDIALFNNLYPYLSAPGNSKLYIHSIYIYMGDSDYFLCNGSKMKISDYVDNSWFNSFKTQSSGKQLWTENREIKNYKFDKNTTPLVSIYKRIKLNGVMVVNIDQNYFNSILNSINSYKNQMILVLNENNQVVFSNNYAQNLPKQTKNKYISLGFKNMSVDSNIDNYHVSNVLSKQYDWKYVSFIPYNIIYKTPNLLIESTFIAAFISLLISLLLAYYFTNRSYKQLSNIITTFQLAKEGKPLPGVKNEENDPYTLILNNIINTFINQSFLTVQLSERKFKLLYSQLCTLQYQINPHFMFNTLQSIDLEIMSISKTPTQANIMISGLSDILRYSLSEPMNLVSIKDEIDINKKYIEIQKYRYNNKFAVIWEYDENILCYKTLKILLQPIIENSIYHAVRDNEKICLIKVKIRKRGDYILFQITDNGLGMTKQRLEEVNKSLILTEEENEETHNHIGLKNINKRIKLKYGEDCYIKVQSKEHLGTSIIFTIKAGL